MTHLRRVLVNYVLAKQSKPYKKKLVGSEIVQYMESLSPDDIDSDLFEKLVKGKQAVLKELKVDSIIPGPEHLNAPNSKREADYLKQAQQGSQIPPIVVDQDYVTIDGNHRRRVAEELGQETILAYVANFVYDAEGDYDDDDDDDEDDDEDDDDDD